MLHKVNSGERVKADDINQFVNLFPVNATDNIFGTDKGTLFQTGNDIGISKFKNEIFETVNEYPTATGTKVSLYLGSDIDQAKSLLGVDQILTYDGKNISALLSSSWYGGENGIRPNGYAVTDLSGISDFLRKLNVSGIDNEGNSVNAVVYSNSVISAEVFKNSLQKFGILQPEIIAENKIATKTSDSIQKIIPGLQQIQEQFKQFDVKVFVESKIENGKKLYKSNTCWYSYYDGETQDQNWAVIFNNKQINSRGSVIEGFNSLTASEWSENLVDSFDVYLNVTIDLTKVEDKESDFWKYNENKTYYEVSLTPFDKNCWTRKGHQISIEEGTSDGYFVQVSYKLAEVIIHNDFTKVNQIFDGTQTYIAPFYEELGDLASDLSGLKSQKPDSEIPQLGLSSLQRDKIVVEISDDMSSTYTAWKFFDFDMPGEGTLSSYDGYELVTRYDDGISKIVKYIQLSSLSSSQVSLDISGDSNFDDDISSVYVSEISGTKRIQLHNFDIPFEHTTDENFSRLGDLSADYYNGNLVILSVANPYGEEARFVLKGKNENGKNEIKYSDLKISLPRYGMGDSRYGDSYSISSFIDDNGNPIHQLYDFSKNEDVKLCCQIEDIGEYYHEGSTSFKNLIDEETEDFDILIRRKNSSGNNYIDYAKLKIDTTPFVHSDSDNFTGELTSKSIETVFDEDNPENTYYQLWDFNDNGNYDTQDIDSTSAYVNLATGEKKEEEEQPKQDFLIRNRDTGLLEYKTIYIKSDGSGGEGGWQETRIENIENNITNIENNITNIENNIENIENNITVIQGDVQDLSGRMDQLSNDFWHKGGNSNNCYGSAIGNENTEEVINLNSKTLWGDWTTEGSLTIGNTVLTEEKLKKLLALLDSSENVLNQSY